MFKKAKQKLILLYTMTSGLILTIAIVGAGYFSVQQSNMSRKANFQNLFYTLSTNVRESKSISHLYLSEMELKNHALISIEDNGSVLRYKGAWNPLTKRTRLVELLRNMAKADKIMTNARPVSMSEFKSETYLIKGEKGEIYFGSVFVVSKAVGYRSLLLLQDSGQNTHSTRKQILYLCGLDFLGIIALFITSSLFVTNSLKPVAENRKKQIEFVGAASHELRSPLSVIRANIAAMKAEPEQTEHFAEGVDRECIRMSRLIDDMLLLASVDGKSWSIRQEEVEPDTLLIELYDIFYSLCKQNGKELILELAEEILPKIKGDKERLKQILSILLDNAIHYTKKPCLIRLGGYKKKNKIIFVVKDHGVGIEESKRKDVFERFYRVDRARKDKQHFGLGLSIAKELAELQNGSLRLEETEGGGCTFLLIIPMISF